MTVDDAAALAARLLELKLGGVAVPKYSLRVVLARMNRSFNALGRQRVDDSFGRSSLVQFFRRES